jgi:hypothetical protein
MITVELRHTSDRASSALLDFLRDLEEQGYCREDIASALGLAVGVAWIHECKEFWLSHALGLAIAEDGLMREDVGGGV